MIRRIRKAPVAIQVTAALLLIDGQWSTASRIAPYITFTGNTRPQAVVQAVTSARIRGVVIEGDTVLGFRLLSLTDDYWFVDHVLEQAHVLRRKGWPDDAGFIVGELPDLDIARISPPNGVHEDLAHLMDLQRFAASLSSNWTASARSRLRW